MSMGGRNYNADWHATISTEMSDSLQQIKLKLVAKIEKFIKKGGKRPFATGQNPFHGQDRDKSKSLTVS